MSQIEPFDWKPEIELVKGLSPRLGAVLQYVQAASKRSTARRRLFVGAVLEDSNLEPDDVINAAAAQSGGCLTNRTYAAVARTAARPSLLKGTV